MTKTISYGFNISEALEFAKIGYNILAYRDIKPSKI